MQTKFRLSVRWLCFAVLLAAVVVRLAAQPGLRAHLASVAAPTQAAEDAPEPAQDGSWPTLCYEPPSHDAPDLPAVTIDNRSGLPLEPDALPEAALALDRAQEGPLVLIIHTHATEAYAGSPDFHSTDPEKSVVRVGQAIADALNARGIPTVHETSLIDLGNYNDAYPRMAGLAEDWLARYPSIQMVLDVHRDSLETGRRHAAGPACGRGRGGLCEAPARHGLERLRAGASGLAAESGQRRPPAGPVRAARARPHARFAAARLTL